MNIGETIVIREGDELTLGTGQRIRYIGNWMWQDVPTPEQAVAPTKVTYAAYAAYLRTPAWQWRRQAALRRADYRCGLCGQRKALEVHHLTYERLGHERPADLSVLCVEHHRQYHGRLPRLSDAQQLLPFRVTPPNGRELN
jgi:hypothetical protein